MSTFGVQADTVVGLGIEHTVGHYAAPQKYLPITSESLSVTNETVEGRELTGTSDVTYAKPGNESVEGSIEMDAKHDCIPWLLYGMRGDRETVAGTGDYNYGYIHTFTPDNRAVPAEAGFNSLSLTIRRAGNLFAYTGVKINRLSFDVNDGLLSMSMDVMGLDEKIPAGLTSLTPTFTLTPPFGAGEYGIYIPANKQNFGTDSFNLELDDGGEILFRLRGSGDFDDGKRTPTINKWGERSVTSSNELDFINKLEYDKYRAVTTDSLRYYCRFQSTVDGEGGGPSRQIKPHLNLFLPNVYLNDYSVDTSGGQGDLVRASGSYMGILPTNAVNVVGAATTRTTEGIYDLEIFTNEDGYAITSDTNYRGDATNKPVGVDLGASRTLTWDLDPANRVTGFTGWGYSLEACWF